MTRPPQSLRLLFSLLAAFVLIGGTEAFARSPSRSRLLGSAILSSRNRKSFLKAEQQQQEKENTEVASRRMGELTEPEQKVYDLLREIHDSGYPFRVVVVGKGAILETTSVLGPKVSIAQSPTTGANLMTLASEDQSFEYHVQLSAVSKMVMVSKETPKKVLRIVRLLNADGDSMSSLILADESEKAIEWYEGILAKYGNDIQL